MKRRMKANVFSVLMTILWSSVLISFFAFLRTRTRLLHICSISTVIMIYLFCAIRLAFPFEVPWAHVVSGGTVYNRIFRMLNFKAGPVRIYEILFVIWLIGMLINLALYSAQYRRAMRHFLNLPRKESRMGQEILDEVDRNSRIKVLESAGINTPCCIGIFRKRIFLPAKDYDREELRYILLHEYTHLENQDILLKLLVRVLCGIYWWNPLVYCLKKDLDQSMEIRCDLSVTGHLKEEERADYLDVMLKTFCESGMPNKSKGVAGLVEERSKSLLERFKIVADMRIVQKKRVNVFAGVVMLLILNVSYSFILQSKYDTPISEIETDENIYNVDVESSYITKQGDIYILHTKSTEIAIDENMVMWLLEEGVAMKGGNNGVLQYRRWNETRE